MTFAQATHDLWHGHEVQIKLVNDDDIFGVLTGCGADYFRINRRVNDDDHTEIINAAHVVRVIPGLKDEP